MLFERSSFFFMFAALTSYVVAYGNALFGQPKLADFVNMTIPLGMGVTLLYVAYRNVFHNHFLIWSPLPYFLVSCALYFGLGPTMYYLGSED
jgi:hypothetical protein